MRKSAQVGMEYMMVVGLALLMIMPLVVIYGYEKESIKDQVSDQQAHNIARKMSDAAETVYYLGKPSKTTLKVYMPHRIDSAIITPYNEIIFNYRTTSGLRNTTPVLCPINITGTITTNPGLQYITLTADDNVVNITN